MRSITVVLLVFLFSYCGDPPKANPDWSLYSPELKSRIDAMQTCQELQEQFDISYSNSDRNRECLQKMLYHSWIKRILKDFFKQSHSF